MLYNNAAGAGAGAVVGTGRCGEVHATTDCLFQTYSAVLCSGVMCRDDAMSGNYMARACNVIWEIDVIILPLYSTVVRAKHSIPG